MRGDRTRHPFRKNSRVPAISASIPCPARRPANSPAPWQAPKALSLTPSVFPFFAFSRLRVKKFLIRTRLDSGIGLTPFAYCHTFTPPLTTPSSEGAWLSHKFKAFRFNSAEIMSRNKLQQLRKDCTTMGHGLILLLF